MSAIALSRQAPRAPARPAPARPAVRVAAFIALAGFGALRWGTMLHRAPTGRLLALVLLAASVAIGGQRLLAGGRRGAGAAAALVIAGCLVALALAGVPVRLIVHLHAAEVANAIGGALGTLPRVNVPYGGADPWVRTTILLGAGALLLYAGAVLMLAGGARAAAARAGAALPLLALAELPATLARPHHPYLDGLLLLALAAALVWGEELGAGEAAGAALMLALAAAGGLALAPSLDRGHAIVDYRTLVGGASIASGESFDWTQRYGSLQWPTSGREIMQITAPHGDYWKTENLDVFDGSGWIRTALVGNPPLPGPDPALLARYTETVTVRITGMRTTDVVAPGSALAPRGLPGGVFGSGSQGTWIAGANLGPGDSYAVTGYSPHPSDLQLSFAPALATVPAAALAPYVSLPRLRPAYAGVVALARRLALGGGPEISVVERVMRLLSLSYAYTQTATRGPDPLARFLLVDGRGYCQQFAGAMALLLRLDGLPARVAVGFTPGSFDSRRRRWIVSDLNAHAWVEIWFPRFGWVRFDPTPGTAATPAAPRLSRIAADQFHRSRPGAAAHHAGAPVPRGPAARALAARRGGGGGGVGFVWAPAALALLAAAALWLAIARRSAGAQVRQADPERLVAELTRALVRTGRDPGEGLTLAQLEHRFRGEPGAAGYLRAVRIARYGGGGPEPSTVQRRLLRARLAYGLGPLGRLRALWALPPRFLRVPRVSHWSRGRRL